MRIQGAVLRRVVAERPYAGSGPLTVEEISLAEPGPGEVLVRIAAAGLCHSDLSVIDGSRVRPLPMLLGHEASGVVEEVGDGVTEVAPGDHVVLSYVPACGACVPCLSGRPALCEPGMRANTAGSLLRGGRRLTAIDGGELHHHLGISAFAERAVVDERSLVRIDPAADLELAAVLGCAVLTGVGAVINTARPPAGSPAVVVGLGGVGLSAVMGAVLAGCHPIVAVDVLPAKLDLARRLGATDGILATEPDAPEQIRASTGGGGEVVVEAVGRVASLQLAYAVTRRGGMTVATGLPAPDQQVMLPALSLVAEERTLKGSYMGSAVPRRDVPRLLALAEAGRLPLRALISGTLDLSEINEGFDRLADASVVRQLVTFG
jgi:alcohol dehydrogenase